ncbi:MAG TPA: putative 2OG-Fe(II) oxygenase [Rhizomicrobium sp.]|jgi:uncharacterized protein (TIGR02466 family)
MALGGHETQALFAEPVFRADIGAAISAEQVEFIKKLKMVQNQVNLISENLYIFEEPQLRSIKKAVQEALDVYASEVMGINQRLYVTQSWSLINRPNVGMHGHSHSNSIVSGSLYYTDMPDPPANMIFQRHNSYQQLELAPKREKRNLYNTPMNAIVPKKGELVLFSSGLMHVVEVNHATQPRYSIAFNTFVKGKLGDFRDVSELVL